VLKHFHAGDDREGRGRFARKGLDGLHAVVDREGFAGCMQPRNIDHGGRKINGCHVRARACQALGEQPATATDIGCTHAV